ncbi:MAG: hypothetical protein EBV03_04055 [Proteobacteria bacterium]|nr:hypothetical protein [Pseudomonadota bacterium]
MIATPNGEVPIETLRVGDIVMTVNALGESSPVKVMETMNRPSKLFSVMTDHGTLVTTDEHPLWVGGHEFRPARELRIGDAVKRWVDGQVVSAIVTGLMQHTDEPEVTVYNMHVENPHVYVAEGFIVHNKIMTPCFPACTMIATPQGAMPIEMLGEGDMVLSVGRDQQVQEARIRRAVQFEDIAIVVVETSAGELRTTAPHPIWVGGDSFMPAGKLKAGDVVMMLAGGVVQQATVLALRQAGSERVYNLQVDQPFTYVAEGFIVH